MSPFEDLFSTIHEASSPQTWSRGVSLARRDSVTGKKSQESDTLTFLVMDRDSGVGAQVALYLDDEDWHCDCHSKEDPCSHVSAAVIALKRAKERGEDLPQSKSVGGKLLYAFYSLAEGDLSFERLIDEGPTRTPLQGGLSLKADLPLTPTQLDWAVEEALRFEKRGILKERELKKVLSVLKGHPCLLDDAPVTIIAPVTPVVEVFDEGQAIVFQARRPLGLTKRYKNGAALTSQGLGFYEVPPLPPKWQEQLKNGHRFHPSGYAEAAEWVRTLNPLLTLQLKSRNLPEQVREKPKLRYQIKRSNQDFQVTFQLVYGQPAIAEVDGHQLVLIGDLAVTPIRDRNEEERLARLLTERYGFHLQTRYDWSPKEAVLHFQNLDSDPLFASGEGQNWVRPVGSLEAELNLARPGGMTFRAGGKTLSLTAREVYQAYQKGQSSLFCPEGMVELPKDWFDTYGKVILSLLSTHKEQDEPTKACLLSLADYEAGFARPFAEEVKQKITQLKPPATMRWPKDLTATLRPYQKEAVLQLFTLKEWGLGALLADDMGLGKTLQAICLIEGYALVIAPKSLVGNWQKELERFRPEIKITVFDGKNRALPPRETQSTQVILATYGLLRQDEALFSKTYDLLICDEAHAIKNYDSQTSKAARRVRAKFRLALTGTPIENHLMDLYAQMEFALPGLLGSRQTFKELYNEELDLQALKKRIAPYLIRRRKEDVLTQLPPKVEQELMVDLYEEDRIYYDALYLSSKKAVLDSLNAGEGVMQALEVILRLRQAACHLRLVGQEGALTSAKLDVLVTKLTELRQAGHKALVFSQWRSFLDLIAARLAEESLEFLQLDGRTQNRQELVERFQTDPSAGIFLISLKAGGVGLNLTEADHVFLLDPWWNPQVEQQAADRAHRIGQTKTVQVIRLIAKGTIEEQVMTLQANKRDLADQLFGESLQALSAQDLRQFFL